MAKMSNWLVTGMIVALAENGLVSVATIHAGAAEQAQTTVSRVAAPSSTTYRALLDRYCVGCHNDRLRTANLSLAAMDLDRVGGNAAVWEKVAQKLRSRAMPPAGRPRPDQTTYDSLSTWLETELDRAAEAQPNPGRPAIHRLNRTEYTNVIRDLLALEIDGASLLPADEMAYGFDNIADLLSVSPGLLERYMLAARKVSRLAIGDPTMKPVAQAYEVSSLLVQDDRVSEDLPFGSRGGIAVRHFFPVDGEYVLRMRLQRDRVDGETIRGLNEPQELDVRLDGERVQVFTVGGKQFRGGAANRGGTPADAGLEVRVPVKAGPRLVGVNLMYQTSIPEGVSPRRLPVWHFGTGREKMGISSLEIAGPYNIQGPGDTPSRRRIFVCRPTEPGDGSACAKDILSTLTRRAFRRPVNDDDLAPLLQLYRDARRTGGFEVGIRRMLEAVLVDPEFLFRVERDPLNVAPSTAYHLTDLELASRLSFFLWSTIPDDKLLDAASRGQLRNPEVFEHEVQRMLADRRSNALVNGFGAQWLYLRNLQELSPDVNQFPEFDDNLRNAFRRETELFLEGQFRDDRSVGDLLSANYTFVNERLAKHYGIPDVYGSHFRKVTLNDERRAGLLGHGSVLTVTSHANRTSPVVRGKWLLENILGAPPPPPPPNVPPFPETTEGERPRSVRERMEQHRANPVCASCHAQMDPLGFALENFDAIGKWRDRDADMPIDSSAALPDGSKFEGPAELRSLLVSRQEEFIAAVTSKLLTYAIGRGVDYYDKSAIRKIVREASSSDYRWSSIILGITRSMPFQMRRSEP